MITLRADAYDLLQELAWIERRDLSGAWPTSRELLSALEELFLVRVTGSVCSITPRGRLAASARVHQRTDTTVSIRVSEILQRGGDDPS